MYVYFTLEISLIIKENHLKVITMLFQFWEKNMNNIDFFSVKYLIVYMIKFYSWLLKIPYLPYLMFNPYLKLVFISKEKTIENKNN
jgi:hypothetical protein